VKVSAAMDGFQQKVLTEKEVMVYGLLTVMPPYSMNIQYFQDLTCTLTP